MSSEKTESCQGCGATVYPEHLETGIAKRVDGKLLCSHCVKEEETSGWTERFIYPGQKFNTVNQLLTNFHLPKSTLYMLVCAFAGKGLMEKAYQEAVQAEYRFFSYGDAMLIL